MSHRLAAALAAMALVLAACSGTAAPSASGPAPTPAVQPSTAAPTSAPPTAEPAGEPVEVRWFVGLGTGSLPEQVPVAQEVVDAFNASQDEVRLVLQAVNFDASRDTLSTMIAAGDPPDIVGPVGILGGEGFRGAWMDLTDLIASTGYDMSAIDPGAAALMAGLGNGRTLAIPVALYPSEIMYIPALFDEAGLAYPPHAYGEPYTWPDGTTTPWDFEALRKVAMILTVDENGRDATQAGFDPQAIVQFGLDIPYPAPRVIGNYFGAGSALAPDGTTAQVPEQWLTAWKWFHDGVWKDHFLASGPVRNGQAWAQGFPFQTGKTAMALTMLWNTCCSPAKGWDNAVIPSYNGTVTADLEADTFRIVAGSKHPEEAMTALAYLTGPDALSKLLPSWGGMPARSDIRDAFFASLDAQFPGGVDWQPVIDGVQYADSPNHEEWLPNPLPVTDAMYARVDTWLSTEQLDMGADAADFAAELQALFDKAP